MASTGPATRPAPATWPVSGRWPCAGPTSGPWSPPRPPASPVDRCRFVDLSPRTSCSAPTGGRSGARPGSPTGPGDAWSPRPAAAAAGWSRSRSARPTPSRTCRPCSTTASPSSSGSALPSAASRSRCRPPARLPGRRRRRRPGSPGPARPGPAGPPQGAGRRFGLGLVHRRGTAAGQRPPGPAHGNRDRADGNADTPIGSQRPGHRRDRARSGNSRPRSTTPHRWNTGQTLASPPRRLSTGDQPVPPPRTTVIPPGDPAPDPAQPSGEERPVVRLLVDREAVQGRVGELGAELRADYQGVEPILVSVLRGGVVFLADLVRAAAMPCLVDFMAISRFDASEDTGVVRIEKDLDLDLSGAHVLVVEDIVDTGLTLTYLLRVLAAREPVSLRVCALLDKRARRIVDV